MQTLRSALATLSAVLGLSAFAATAPPVSATAADQALAAYFRTETAKIEWACLTDIKTRADWETKREVYRRQLQDMLGLYPWPERGDLRATVTGCLEPDEFRVEKLHFQSLPGLYVTANLYLPKTISARLPGILYVCGHSRVVTNGVSCGNKTGYQQHGAWFARHGYVCLTIDTVQLGEIEGLHHGTYREGLWWWNARGYTPAGVEAWNGIRALDYLVSRPEVDPDRLGITGRSGGGAYSWFIAALDERVKAAAPIAGITDLHNHVVDGTVEGHCDCMFFVNTYRWDYPLLAALVAPRPLLLGNSDKDTIFPLEGVVRVQEKVRRIYALEDATDKLGLLITEGPHRDTQDLQVPVFRWFNRWLKQEDTPVEKAAERFFAPQDLRVFAQLPTDAINTNIHESFVPQARPGPDGLGAAARQAWRAARVDELKSRCFAGWPDADGRPALAPTRSEERDGLWFRTWDFLSQPGVPLRLYALGSCQTGSQGTVSLRILGAADWTNWVATLRGVFSTGLAEECVAFGDRAPTPDTAPWAALVKSATEEGTTCLWLAPRGIGLTAWSGDAAKARQIRRRFMLLGQTLDGMRVWDIRQAIQATRRLFPGAPLELEAANDMAVNALYASFFELPPRKLILHQLPPTHREGPDYLNVLRVWDLPEAVAAAGDRGEVAAD